MSDTPKTDELAKRDFVPDGLWIRHARELERENSALNRKLDDILTNKDYDGGVRFWINKHDAVLLREASLCAENAALLGEVVKANGLLDMQMKELAKLREDSKIVDELCALHGCGREFLMVWCRAAAYAQKEYTRKEAQP